MPPTKPPIFPIKVLDDVYVFGILKAKEKEKEDFKKLGSLEKIELLVSKEPFGSKVRIRDPKSSEESSEDDKIFYVPTFGKFVVSCYGNTYIKFLKEGLARAEAKQIFSKLQEEYAHILSYSSYMKDLIHSKKEN